MKSQAQFLEETAAKRPTFTTTIGLSEIDEIREDIDQLTANLGVSIKDSIPLYSNLKPMGKLVSSFEAIEIKDKCEIKDFDKFK
mmetsp:Transcript_12757/g.10908  ORF Transcript_12757/g.10908 Transcript_12757/m.10908 type:complete len:84 (+) Transcript_12757:654-905(+)|eukprot:CAMPEP_0114586456 /NCGR_PEP_ID=MMETSP0125-20121206/9676_1 /TAXON_ID=485358 ORGANISM="Aristerostoma sp., Strain ATCC 50986" /NCGR_SAMPLE_ID=MMETSP0125 /ASSEMBLY_ACC=CAM_ASM_000245 /LENGTH=83 /DNA_ID=CAMNT_0001781905 /DNA_START=636 /DNA_END=887 /DNA_ORIENTATION=-